MTALVERKANWEATRSNFQWVIPEHFNIAHAVCDRHAKDPDKIAMIHETESGKVETWTFRQIQQSANRLANALEGLGIQPGERVGIVLPQCPETGIAHMAIYKTGAVALPLANLFGPEALKYRLQDSGAKVVITDLENREKLHEIMDELEELEYLILLDDKVEKGELSWKRLLDSSSDEYVTRKTSSEDPCWVIYTSGTTGNPKGALHAHRALLGHLPGYELSHDFAPQPGDLAWTPADWAWIGGLANILLCSWFHGIPVLGFRFRRFDPEKALALIEKHRIRNTFLPPTALKFMRQLPQCSSRHETSLRSIMSAGEPLGAEMLKWGEECLDVRINEMYGQTEVNYFIGNSQTLTSAKPGSMGKPYPGHRAAVIDEDGNLLGPGEMGEIAFHTPGDPIVFLKYWNNEKGTHEKFNGDWIRSGDEGSLDEDGFFWFSGRTDDVITSSGYRIGPSEIENQLLKHPAVALAAAVGYPDEMRGHLVKAFIRLNPDYEQSEKLKKEISSFVKTRLAAHEYPRIIEFLEEFPLTTTGKVMRRVLRDRD
ncbi:MAG: AMP-binding protein [SAR324 cluster bacterium]|nr:AMP-binding protein [SAR324 cluster bacterium]